jgi:hypothetical protein
LLAGILVLGSASFFLVTEMRKNDPRERDRPKPFAHPSQPPKGPETEPRPYFKPTE